MKRLFIGILMCLSMIGVVAGIWYAYHMMMYNAFMFFMGSIMLEHWVTNSKLKDEINILMKYTHYHDNDDE